MPTTKIKLDLPGCEELLAGLDVRRLHPPLPRAEEAAAGAKHALAGKLEEFAGLERESATLPDGSAVARRRPPLSRARSAGATPRCSWSESSSAP